ncbi:hypothetical protein JX265_008857 [Neoarthrinium moseri]|uniref:Major facilitator superfamily (MFS) profile domain-containing protein n=1 Tax=Neoarthrinium moseri TaxID=1658444 RepID=A0A9P9WHN8_9PEZI|nr:hypothetical protein JX265_008857 [Neoarthrinium moseri]
MLSSTFLFATDNIIVADAQPAIVNDFGPIELLPWIWTGFALENMTILSWGKAYGIFNMKWIYIQHSALRSGSAICGAAPTMDVLVVGRIIAGVGGSGMYSGTLSYVSILANEKEKPVYVAGSTDLWGIGSVLGSVVGRVFAASPPTWRWGCYINLVVGAVFAPVYIFLFPSVIPKPASSCCLTMVTSFGGLVYDWESTAMITMWVVVSVLLIASILALRYHPGLAKEDRLYPVHYLKNPLMLNIQHQVFLSSGIILVSTTNETTNNSNVYGYMILIGTGCGCYIVAGFAIAPGHTVPKDMANLSTFQNTAVDKFRNVLPNSSEEQITQLVAGTSSRAYKELSDEDQKLVIPEVTSAMTNEWLMCAVAAALSFVCSLLLYKPKAGSEPASEKRT